MTLTPVPYKFTPADSVAIEALGYVITSQIISEIDFSDFMLTTYTNFNLLKLLQVVERILGPLTKLPIVKEIKFNDVSNKLVIQLYNQFKDEAEALIFKRTFIRRQRIF